MTILIMNLFELFKYITLTNNVIFNFFNNKQLFFNVFILTKIIIYITIIKYHIILNIFKQNSLYFILPSLLKWTIIYEL